MLRMPATIAKVRPRPVAHRRTGLQPLSDGRGLLTMHTTGDGLVVPENEQAYRSAVDRAGDGAALRQIFVHRAGHCAFTPAETITAVQALVSRLDTGRWDLAALDPASLNARAAALGPQFNIFQVGTTIKPTAPAFLRYRAAPYLRPLDLAPGGR